MKRISILVLALCSIMLCCGVYARPKHKVTIPNHNDSTTPFLGPTLRLSTSSYMAYEKAAYSFAGELGVKNLRGSATLAWAITDYQRFKLSAELLSQELTYSFFTGNDDQWMSQGAVSGDYLLDLNTIYDLLLDLNGYYSYAPGKGQSALRVHNAFARNGVHYGVAELRRIAGSRAYGINPGFILLPWTGTKIALHLNYDNVRYQTHYTNRYMARPDRGTNGLGGTIRVDQLISDAFTLGLGAAVRKPFNDYEVNIDYENDHWGGRWIVGLYGDYVDGKAPLPNSWNLGLHADYYFDPCVSVAVPAANAKGESSSVWQRNPSTFVTWAGDPAVHMPEVLAIADQRVELSIPETPVR